MMTLDEIAVVLAEHEQKILHMNERIDDLKDKNDTIEELVLSVQKLALSLEALTKKVVDNEDKQKDFSNRLVAVEQYPVKDKAERHDKFIAQITTLVVGAIVGYLIKTFFGI